MSPGAFLVNLLQARNDPRLAQYFDPNAAGQYVGAAPGQQGSATISTFDETRVGPGFRQPIVTYGREPAHHRRVGVQARADGCGAPGVQRRTAGRGSAGGSGARRSPTS